jgi:hypothetical protein
VLSGNRREAIEHGRHPSNHQLAVVDHNQPARPILLVNGTEIAGNAVDDTAPIRL